MYLPFDDSVSISDAMSGEWNGWKHFEAYCLDAPPEIPSGHSSSSHISANIPRPGELDGVV